MPDTCYGSTVWKAIKITIQQVQEKNSCYHLAIINDENMGEQICKTCGQVLVNDMVDQTFEKYSEDFEKSRTGPKISITMHDGGLSTVIGKSNFDSNHKPVSSSMKGSINRMRIWDSRSKINTTSRKNLVIALLEISKLKEKMALSDGIIERASYLYRKAAEKQLVRGRSVRAVVGACLYAACRDYETTRTIIEISKYMNEKRRSIAQSYRILFQELNLKASVPDSTNSIIRFSNNLGLSEQTKRDAIFVLDSLKEKKVIAGKKPDAVAAVVIYMACIRNNVNISQYKISKISGISSITIRNRFKEFKKFVKLI